MTQCGEMGCGSWDQRKDVENGEDDRMCEKCYDARWGNIEVF